MRRRVARNSCKEQQSKVIIKHKNTKSKKEVDGKAVFVTKYPSDSGAAGTVGATGCFVV